MERTPFAQSTDATSYRASPTLAPESFAAAPASTTEAQEAGNLVRDMKHASLQQANEMIRFADVKAAAVLAAAGVLAGRLPSAHGPWATGVLLVAGACVALSALLALYALAPRRQVTTGSLHYYEHVARRYGNDQEAFIDAWLEAAADINAFERAVLAQIWAVNMVASRKFTRVAWSIRALVIGLVALAAVALA
ncbi:Pycsar system effector family protein [Micromonospora trifolii]|uniref:Pycsar system effector family protein n=1 Tax=Micromonospora trifolii TaxID=2911208 RepID=UPI003D2F4370